MEMMYHFKVHKEADGYWAECVELQGCQTQGDTMAELKANAQEALDLFLSEPVDSKVILPFPRKVATHKNMLLVKPSTAVAFAFVLRMARLRNKKTQKQMADSLGYKSTNAYQKLESAKTTNPGLETLAKLKSVLPDLEIDSIL